MKILDLKKEHESLYFNCLEDWSQEMRDSGDHKCMWYDKMKDKGLRVKLAADDTGTIGGMIQYYPAEFAAIEGEGLYFISCTWVHGYKEGRGNFQKKGMGSALLKAAEEDSRRLGAKGLVAWGLALPIWMKASWYKKHGYKVADKNGIAVLMWKKFCNDAVAPRWIRQKKKPPVETGQVTVTAFLHGGCPAQNIVYERAQRVSLEFPEKVNFVKIDTSERDTLQEWGIHDALFIDGKEVRTGPPPSYGKLRRMIEKRVKKIKK